MRREVTLIIQAGVLQTARALRFVFLQPPLEFEVEGHGSAMDLL